MSKTLMRIFSSSLNHKNVRLPKNSEIKAFDAYGFPVSRNIKVRTINLSTYLRDLEEGTRVATFLKEIARRSGAAVGIKLELWVAGHKIDGRAGLAGLR